MPGNLEYECSEIVSTTEGPVKGFVKDGMSRFLGIPYAAPPIGQLRWRPPIPPVPWKEPIEAITFGSVCAQDAPCFPGFGHTSSTEDCLYLNVVTPFKSEHRPKLPVMVLIPGGGLFCGGSNDYDPTRLVEEGNVVFVSPNYRLGVFGFFSHPAINTEDHPLGNYGIMDQQLALIWVQKNIEAFGGDASNITIMGESAGGISVMVHLASPRSIGLFHKAIVQSGGSPATISPPTLDSVQQRGVALASAAGCQEQEQTPENLRLLSIKEIMVANAIPPGTFGVGQFTVGLMEDGIVVPRSLRERFSSGDFSRVPIICGVNKDEFSWFQAMMEFSTGSVISADGYPQTLALVLEAAASFRILGLEIPPEALNEVLQRYPLSSHSNASRAVAAAVGDAGIISTCGRRTARVLKQFVSHVYAYEFDVPDSPVSWPEVSFSYGSGHTQELQYIFPRFCGGSGKAQPLNEPQQELAKEMVLYWTTFARQGTPNIEGSETPAKCHWPVYTAQDDNIMLLCAPNPQMVNGWGKRHHSDFWDSFYT